MIRRIEIKNSPNFSEINCFGRCDDCLLRFVCYTSVGNLIIDYKTFCEWYNLYVKNSYMG